MENKVRIKITIHVYSSDWTILFKDQMISDFISRSIPAKQFMKFLKTRLPITIDLIRQELSNAKNKKKREIKNQDGC
jgi:hypothetical protein